MSISDGARRIIVARENTLKPWSWDACKSRLLELRAGNNAEAAREFWRRIDELVGQARNRNEQAILEENRARLEDIWEREGMQGWFTALLLTETNHEADYGFGGEPEESNHAFGDDDYAF